MRPLLFALRSLVRQPGRTSLGVLGIAAVGALLFDMLLLSRGLLVSFKEILDSAGYNVRVVATEDLPMAAPPMTHVSEALAAVSRLPEVQEVVPLCFGRGTVDGERSLDIFFSGADPDKRRRPWRLLDGQDLVPPSSPLPPLLVNRRLAAVGHIWIGETVSVRASCQTDASALPLSHFKVVGIADFPFDDASALTAVTTLRAFRRACGGAEDEADLLLVASSEHVGASAAVAAIRALRPDLHAFSNDELLRRFQQVGFSYFSQISNVLSSVTLLFASMLIGVLLTVSVNQRLGEIAALRALGLSRARVVADVFWQSFLLVGLGGALSLPVGLVLARWLDQILRDMPEIPQTAHFFIFEPRALGLHASLLALTALLAALYPMSLVARLPIAATLRNEVVT
jgi:ABC-type lipoprotein release transport system permease subunit